MTAFFKRSLRVAEHFVQTAVVIDDKAFEVLAEQVPEEVHAPPTLSSASPAHEPAGSWAQCTKSSFSRSSNLVPPLLKESPEQTEHEVSTPNPRPALDGRQPPTASQAPNAPTGAARTNLTASAAASPQNNPEQVADGPHALNPERVINAFARKRIICSVLKRKRGDNFDDPGSPCHLLATTADIIVLDWVFLGEDLDHGDAAMQIVSSIVENSQRTAPAQLRLVILYTGEQDLEQVINRVAEKLGKTEGFIREGPFGVRVRATRIVVLGKAGVSRTGSSAERAVTYEEIADKSVEEFAKMTSGLVSNVVLESLARIREETHRVITRFGPNLDAAFLAHRALLKTPAEGNEQLLPLIASELQAILEDSSLSDLLTETAIEEWLEARGVAGPAFAAEPALADASKAQQALRDICARGISAHEDFTTPSKPGWVTKLAKGDRGTVLHDLVNVIAGKQVVNGNEELAAIMSLRPFYFVPERMLALGTILESDDNGIAEYWVCLQPACDCFVRKDGPIRAFPFLRLTEGAEKFNLVVPRDKGFVRLSAEAKLYKVCMFEFEARPPSQTVQANCDSTDFSFQSVQGKTFRWLAQLKFTHAQSIAQKTASEAGRVGVNDSEWLRRCGK